jgi:hypothetical protein
LITTITTAPLIIAQRLRKGACGSARGALRMISDTLTAVHRLRDAAACALSDTSGSDTSGPPKPLLRSNSALFGHRTIGAAPRGGADVSITTGLNQ